jgi:hypothetical protein
MKNLTEQEVFQPLMRERTPVSAAAWVVVRDTQAAEDAGLETDRIELHSGRRSE